MNIEILIELILFFVLLIALAFFSMSETGIVSLSDIDMKNLKVKKPKLLKSINFLEQNTDQAVTTIVVGLNLCVVGISVISASLISEFGIRGNLKENLLFHAAVIIITLIFGNIFPKTYARYNTKKIASPMLSFVRFFSRLTKPIVIFLLKISRYFERNIPKRKESAAVQASEIDFLLSNEITSPLSFDSREIVSNIMDFSETRVSQVMTPREELFAVDINGNREKIIKKIIDSKYSRVPVFKQHLSNIIGIIYTKDLALSWHNADIIILEDLIKPVYYVPENAKVNTILKEFKLGHHHCAIVVDEFALTVGLVSIEDLLEEIVGEVLDEFDDIADIAQTHILTFNKGEYLIDAQQSVLDVNENTDLAIPDGDYSTLGGWVLTLFDRIPKKGEKIIWKNFEIEIKQADQKKINRIFIKCITK
jgi:CBS domain containing-hemolysin-like protein